MILLKKLLFEDKPFGDYLFGDDDGLLALQGGKTKESDTEKEKRLFHALEAWYTDSYDGFEEYGKVLLKYKSDYPKLLDPRVDGYKYAYRGITKADRTLSVMNFLNTNTSKIKFSKVKRDNYRMYAEGYLYNTTRGVTSWSASKEKFSNTNRPQGTSYGNVVFEAPINSNFVINPSLSKNSTDGTIHAFSVEEETVFVGNSITCNLYVDILRGNRYSFINGLRFDSVDYEKLNNFVNKEIARIDSH